MIETHVVALDNRFAPEPKAGEIRVEQREPAKPTPLWVKLWSTVTETRVAAREIRGLPLPITLLGLGSRGRPGARQNISLAEPDRVEETRASPAPQTLAVDLGRRAAK